MEKNIENRAMNISNHLESAICFAKKMKLQDTLDKLEEIISAIYTDYHDLYDQMVSNGEWRPGRDSIKDNIDEAEDLIEQVQEIIEDI